MMTAQNTAKGHKPHFTVCLCVGCVHACVCVGGGHVYVGKSNRARESQWQLLYCIVFYLLSAENMQGHTLNWYSYFT